MRKRSSPLRFWTLAVAWLLAALTGCSSSALREVYQQKMAHEIRTLEDQLYEADYQNRVLHEQLERCRVRTPNEPDSSPAARATLEPPDLPDAPRRRPSGSVPEPTPDPETNRRDVDDALDLDPDDLELPSLDPGELVDPESLDDANESFLPEQPLLPAPGLPEPPGRDDLMIPPIEPGEVLPPPADGAAADAPRPGQVELPESVTAAAGMPKQLSIHPTLSSGVDADGEQQRMTLVIQVTDERGRTVDLDNFQIDAELSVVLLDPERDAAEARIGRWDFSPEQVLPLVKQSPISGLHVPLSWRGAPPQGEHVVAHVRLRGEEDEMRCERRLEAGKPKAIADWTPRGDDVRR